MTEKAVSIILPVRNEEQYITQCLRSISAQDYPKDSMEVLIAEGMSDDGTLGRIAEYDSVDNELEIMVLKNDKMTVSAGRNLALRHARGQVVICMDAHAVYAPDYISSCLAVMESTGAANVGGHMRALPANGSALAQASMLANDSPFGLGGGRFHDPEHEGYVETVWMGCYKKEALEKAGYYDERRTRTEDIDLNRRLINAGYKIYLSPKIKAWYYPRTNLVDLWRQRWADGCEITRFLPDNPKAPRLRHFVPLLFVSSLLLLAAVAVFYHPQAPAGALFLSGIKKALGMRTPAFSGLFDLKHWDLRLAALRLLLLELLAYFAAMLFFVCRAGRSREVEKIGRSDHEKMGKGKEQKAGEGDPNFPTSQPLSVPATPGALALLPLVFLTLHFSYGLGSIGGLLTLPFRGKGKGM